ncbi:hypothetical protein AMAG_13215 [Allomyces macrogynus ATCC 38327]|uniref:Uncharacterized protein n=1 Tax=Allomyces macrogynus (strain ATCC 38327) TaxID=578462 RepID=A0A0L0T0E2_ALLM3|nr:hypothetical protein AMAG_13215 [Allomyces macrogynus ATCC 38327]|eukprot:KNE68044.1 hypothetical protein AMAG_13215 [Allomyces macrogynus ATCC 38327]
MPGPPPPPPNGNQSAREPEFIRLLDPSGATILDSVAVDYEDSFCLDTFGELVAAHAALPLPVSTKPGMLPGPAGSAATANPDGSRNRAFILARVQTWDHRQPDKAYFSYYAAHHLNKILFQTQIYLGRKLIHRIHVLNPLTNTDIIGNVLYFIVKPRDPAPPSVAKSAAIDPPRAAPTPFVPRLHLDIERAAPPTTSRRKSSIFGTLLPSRRSSMQPDTAATSVSDVTLLTTPQTWTMKTQLVATLDDDARAASPSSGNLIAQAARRLSTSGRRRSLAPPAPPTALELTGGSVATVLSDAAHPETPVLTTSRHRGSVFATRTTQSSTAGTIKTKKPRSASTGNARMHSSGSGGGSLIASPTTASDTASRRRHTAYGTSIAAPLGHSSPMIVKSATGIISKLPSGPIVVGQHRAAVTKVSVPPGTVTQFAVPVPIDALPQIAPATPPRRRRGMSLSNSNQEDVAGWMHQVRMAAALGASGGAAGAADAPIPEDEDPATTAEPVVEPTDPDAVAVDDVVFYDAVLIATDNDFLESAAVRAVFRDNALSPSDAALFELPPYTGESDSQMHDPSSEHPQQQSRAALPMVLFADDTTLCDSCLPSRPSGWLTFSPHRCKCYFIVLAASFACIFVLLLLIRNGTPDGTPPSGQGQRMVAGGTQRHRDGAT